MNIISCTENRHASAILAIFNHAILNSTALYDYQPRPLESMTQWFASKRMNDFPVVGVESEQGTLLGFASYGTFRAWAAYQFTGSIRFISILIFVDRDWAACCWMR